jgi:alkylation response protein AidB-like acyl-CoA dehydrogenase
MTRTELGAEAQALVEQVRTLARDRFASRAARYDAESIFPAENYADLRAAGLLGLTVPVAYGGHGADSHTYALCLLEMAKGCPATALTFNMHATVLTFIAALATEEQKRRYFAEVVREGKLMASITSEPESSFRDKFVLQTVFRPVASGYQVSGVKQFCSLGESADYYFVSGMREGSASAREGLLSALIQRTAPGVKVEGTWNAMGMRGTVSHTIRYETFVDESQVIGPPAGLFGIDLSGFALGYSATYLGIGEAALDYILEFVKTKTIRPSTEPLSHHPVTQRTIGELATAVRAARLLLFEAARVRDSGDRAGAMLAVNQSKYLSAETGAMVTERAIRLAGGRGILRDMPLERWHRDAMAGPVMPPSSDRCLETVGKVLCGLEARTLDFQ